MKNPSCDTKIAGGKLFVYRIQTNERGDKSANRINHVAPVLYMCAVGQDDLGGCIFCAAVTASARMDMTIFILRIPKSSPLGRTI